MDSTLPSSTANSSSAESSLWSPLCSTTSDITTTSSTVSCDLFDYSYVTPEQRSTTTTDNHDTLSTEGTPILNSQVPLFVSRDLAIQETIDVVLSVINQIKDIEHKEAKEEDEVASVGINHIKHNFTHLAMTSNGHPGYFRGYVDNGSIRVYRTYTLPKLDQPPIDKDILAKAPEYPGATVTNPQKLFRGSAFDCGHL